MSLAIEKQAELVVYKDPQSPAWRPSLIRNSKHSLLRNRKNELLRYATVTSSGLVTEE